MTKKTGGTSRYAGYRTGPDIPWKPYHNNVHEYKPHTYGSTVRSYDRVHEYRKVHEYTRIHEHTYTEYKSSYKHEYREYKLNLKDREPRAVHPPPPPKVARQTVKKRYGDLHVCYAQPMGPDIRVKEHKFKEYQKSEYQPTYSEYNARTGPYMDKKWTQYNGNVGYVLTPYNHYPLRWGIYEKRSVDENDNDFIKEPTQTSLSKVKPIVYIEEPVEENEPDAIEEEEPVIAETGLYRDPTIENTPFVEQEDDFYAAPLVVTDQVVTPLPIEDPEQPPQDESPEPEEEDIVATPVVAAAAVASTGGHTAPVQEEADSVPEDQSQGTAQQNTDPVPEPVDNDPYVAPVVVAAAASSSNDDVAPPQQETAPAEPVEESGRWSSLTTHGAEGNVDDNLTPVEAVVAGAVVGGAVASQPDPVQSGPPYTEAVDEAPTTESAAPEAEIAAAPVEAAPVVAAAAVVAESAPSDASTVPTDSGSRLPPEVVANIEAYSYAHASEQSAIGTVKRTLDMMF